jgi:hypothetical protein
MAAKKTKRRFSAWDKSWDWGKAREWMKENPLASWLEFKKVYPSFPYSDSAYYAMRRSMNDPSLYDGLHRTKSRGPHIYQILGQLDKDLIEKSTPLDAMNRLMEIIEKDGKSGIELVELAQPRVIEVRRFTRG